MLSLSLRLSLSVFSKLEEDLTVMQNFRFAKFYVIIACCEDIYGCYYFQKRINDEFHP